MSWTTSSKNLGFWLLSVNLPEERPLWQAQSSIEQSVVEVINKSAFGHQARASCESIPDLPNLWFSKPIWQERIDSLRKAFEVKSWGLRPKLWEVNEGIARRSKVCADDFFNFCEINSHVAISIWRILGHISANLLKQLVQSFSVRCPFLWGSKSAKSSRSKDSVRL